MNRNIYIRGNMLTENFKRCCYHVNNVLVKTFYSDCACKGIILLNQNCRFFCACVSVTLVASCSCKVILILAKGILIMESLRIVCVYVCVCVSERILL